MYNFTIAIKKLKYKNIIFNFFIKKVFISYKKF